MKQYEHNYIMEEINNTSHEDNSFTSSLYQHYAPKLLAYIGRHIPSTNDAEDILFEVFLIAFEHEQDLCIMQEDEQRAWLWTVARNKVIDHQRRLRRRPAIPLEQLVEVSACDEYTPEKAALRKEEHESLHTHLKQLSALQQEVLHLRFSGGLRCAEIATVLHKREGAIRTLISRALNTLRTIYES